MDLFTGLMIPFAGTSLGALTVCFMKKQINRRVEAFLLGFAAGVMIAASVWSLLMPSIEMAREQGLIAWLPASAGFLLGVAFLLALDCLIARLHRSADCSEDAPASFPKNAMMIFAVTLHNVPEGMAVGVAFSGALLGDVGITMAAAFALSLGIGIQNFPEGAIISLPLRSEGMSKPRAFGIGVLSGVVEPIGAVVTILLTGAVKAMLPYLLAFAAGAMIYVVTGELIPEAQSGRHANTAAIGVATGFVIMMALDVALG